MIEVKGLVKQYGNSLAVDHLDFTIEDGQIFGFLGPNGAGKSTTMNMITGCLAATEGQILINGKDIYEEPDAAKKCIGYLPEIPPLYTDMTTYEYLKFVGEAKKIPSQTIKAEIQTVLEKTELTNVKNRLIKNLSKGYKQRVGIAQAILGNPEIIILDEPTVGLDPKQLIEIRELIRELGKNHTVILSSHILSEISAVCNNIMIISQGKLVAMDKTENLAQHLTETKKLTLTVRGTEEDIKNALNCIAGIKNIEFAPSHEANSVDVFVEIVSTSDIRDLIFYALAEAKCPILELSLTKANLEEVFIELVDDAPKEENIMTEEKTEEKEAE